MEGMSEPRAEFERIFREHYAAVYRYATRRVESAAVQDVVADTFLAAWRRFDQVDGDPLPWLLGIARRVCANHLRGRERRAALRERLMADPTARHSAALAMTVSCWRRWPCCVRRTAKRLLLVGWDGLSNPQAARVAGCSTGAFAVRLHRARRRLARAVNSKRAGDSAAKDNQEGVVIHDVT